MKKFEISMIKILRIIFMKILMQILDWMKKKKQFYLFIHK